MQQIAIMTRRDSETLFYELLARNQTNQLKHLCKKIPRKMLYKYLRQLQHIQDSTGLNIIQKKAAICSITGLPNIVIERQCNIRIEQTGTGCVVILNSPAVRED